MHVPSRFCVYVHLTTSFCYLGGGSCTDLQQTVTGQAVPPQTATGFYYPSQGQAVCHRGACAQAFSHTLPLSFGEAAAFYRSTWPTILINLNKRETFTFISQPFQCHRHLFAQQRGGTETPEFLLLAWMRQTKKTQRTTEFLAFIIKMGMITLIKMKKSLLTLCTWKTLNTKIIPNAVCAF